MTENAAKKNQAQLSKDGKGVGLRLGIKKVGCSGFAYTLDYADEVRVAGTVFESHNAVLVVAEVSLPFLDGSHVDFVTEGFKETFKFNNPNAASECGRGESFNLKKATTQP